MKNEGNRKADFNLFGDNDDESSKHGANAIKHSTVVISTEVL
jgi:hypothetical protein